MQMSALSPDRAVTKIEARRRRLALAEADHACDREGLPPASQFARSFDEAWICGTVSADDVVAELVTFHRQVD